MKNIKSVLILVAGFLIWQRSDAQKSYKQVEQKTMVKPTSVENDGTQKLSIVQVKEEQKLSSSPAIVVTLENATEPVKSEDTVIPVTTVESCRQLINTIETKMAWVRSNKKEHHQAKISGWYDQMKSEIERQEKLIKELQSK